MDYKYTEKALTEPIDPEREVWRANQFRFVQDGPRVLKVPTYNKRYFNSGLTGTFSELIYSNPTTGTAKNTFTVEATPLLNDSTGMGPQAMLPPWFWLPSRSRGQTVRLVVRGIFSTTATPTFQFITRLSTTIDAITGAIVGETSALTTGSAISNQLWAYEQDIQVTLEGKAGANATVRGLGTLLSPGGLASPFGGSVFANNASPGTVATLDQSIINYVAFNVICSASSVSNSVQALQLLLFGLN